MPRDFFLDVVVVATKIRRSSRRLKDLLDGVPLEKFRRIVGIFNAVVPEELKTRSNNDSYDNPLVNEFQQLRSQIHQRIEEFRNLPQKARAQIDDVERAEHLTDELADDIHNLHLLLGALLPADALQYALPGYRDEYSGRVSAVLFQAYQSSPGYKQVNAANGELGASEKLQLLRADYIHLVNELRKITMSVYHVELARGALMKNLRDTYLKLIGGAGAVVLTIFALSTRQDPPYNNVPMAIALLGCCAIAGATGSFVSALSRIDAIPENLAIARSLTVLRYSASIWVVPVTGFVFAILLSLLLAGGLLSGPIFPQLVSGGQSEAAFNLTNIARFLGWGFIAGFAERLMPDVVDRLAKKAEKLEDKSVKP
jgi:hypothetical protein